MRRTAAVVALALASMTLSACGLEKTILARIDAEGSDGLVGDDAKKDGPSDDRGKPPDGGGMCLRGQTCAGTGASCSVRCGQGALESMDCYCDAQLKILFCDDQYCPTTACPKLLPDDGMVCTDAESGLTCSTRVGGGLTCRCASGTWSCVPSV